MARALLALAFLAVVFAPQYARCLEAADCCGGEATGCSPPAAACCVERATPAATAGTPLGVGTGTGAAQASPSAPILGLPPVPVRAAGTATPLPRGLPAYLAHHALLL